MLCDNPEGWDGVEDGKKVQEEGTYIYLRLIDFNVQQKATPHCKATILQLKIK